MAYTYTSSSGGSSGVQDGKAVYTPWSKRGVACAWATSTVALYGTRRPKHHWLACAQAGS